MDSRAAHENDEVGGTAFAVVASRLDSQPSAENDDSFLSVILEGAVRLSSGIHCLLHSYKKVNTIAL